MPIGAVFNVLIWKEKNDNLKFRLKFKNHKKYEIL